MIIRVLAGDRRLALVSVRRRRQGWRMDDRLREDTSASGKLAQPPRHVAARQLRGRLPDRPRQPHSGWLLRSLAFIQCVLSQCSSELNIYSVCLQMFEDIACDDGDSAFSTSTSSRIPLDSPSSNQNSPRPQQQEPEPAVQSIPKNCSVAPLTSPNTNSNNNNNNSNSSRAELSRSSIVAFEKPQADSRVFSCSSRTVAAVE